MILKINKIKYEVRELTVGECLPLMEYGENSGLEMVKLSVSVDGVAIGGRVTELKYSVFNRLMAAVNKIHGMSEDDDKGE